MALMMLFFLFLSSSCPIDNWSIDKCAHTYTCMCANITCSTVPDLCYVCTYAYEKKRREAERESEDYAHQRRRRRSRREARLWFFSSYTLVSVFHASSMGVNIYMLRIGQEGRKSKSKLMMQWRQAHWQPWWAVYVNACRRVMRKRQSQSKQDRSEMEMMHIVHRNPLRII